MKRIDLETSLEFSKIDMELEELPLSEDGNPCLDLSHCKTKEEVVQALIPFAGSENRAREWLEEMSKANVNLQKQFEKTH